MGVVSARKQGRTSGWWACTAVLVKGVEGVCWKALGPLLRLHACYELLHGWAALAPSSAPVLWQLAQAARGHSARRPAQVCAVTRGGGFAEEVVVRDGAALRLPPGADVAAAAGAALQRARSRGAPGSARGRLRVAGQAATSVSAPTRRCGACRGRCVGDSLREAAQRMCVRPEQRVPVQVEGGQRAVLSGLCLRRRGRALLPGRQPLVLPVTLHITLGPVCSLRESLPVDDAGGRQVRRATQRRGAPTRAAQACRWPLAPRTWR